MLAPDYILRLSEGAEEIASQLHIDIIRRVIRRVMLRLQRKDDYLLTAIDKWQLETLQEAGFLREELVEEIAKATGRQMNAIKEVFAFTDSGSIARFAASSVRICQQAGVMVGDKVGTFRPNDTATRAEAATMYSNFLKNCQTDFQSDCTSLHSHQQMEECSPSSTSFAECTVA